MSPIAWDQSFSVGHPRVDSQHKEFLALMNTMEQVCSADSDIHSRMQRLSILKSLMEFSENHFRLENRLMREYGYPDAYSHWRSHKNFDIGIYALYRKVLGGESVSDAGIYMILRDKFRKHILKEDKLMFTALFSRESPRGFSEPDPGLAASTEYFYSFKEAHNEKEGCNCL